MRRCASQSDEPESVSGCASVEAVGFPERLAEHRSSEERLREDHWQRRGGQGRIPRLDRQRGDRPKYIKTGKNSLTSDGTTILGRSAITTEIHGTQCNKRDAT